METYTDLSGNECVVWTDENGAMQSMIKPAYELSQVEHLTEIVPANE